MGTIIISVIAQLLVWALFFLSDFIEETYPAYYGLAIIAAVILPFIMPVLYLIFQKRIHDRAVTKWENTAAVLCSWTIGNILMIRILVPLLGKNHWLIQQRTGSWDYFLNGIEYYIFLFLNIVLPFLIVGVWNLIVWIIKKML